MASRSRASHRQKTHADSIVHQVTADDAEQDLQALPAPVVRIPTEVPHKLEFFVGNMLSKRLLCSCRKV